MLPPASAYPPSTELVTTIYPTITSKVRCSAIREDFVAAMHD
jgi:hypothetical protein